MVLEALLSAKRLERVIGRFLKVKPYLWIYEYFWRDPGSGLRDMTVFFGRYLSLITSNLKLTFAVGRP
jgi:hypothetical protein